MIQLKAANLAITKLMAGITAADTSFTVEDATLFPDAPFMVTIDAEIMQVGAIDKLTHTFSNVLRGQEGTAAAPHEVGASVDNRWTAGTFNELVTSINEVFTSVSSGKDALASAITDMGQSATGSDTFPTLAGKVRDISKDADAATGDVINGKTFYQGGGKKTGSMQDNGLVTITPGPLDQDLKGHYADGSKVAAVTFDPTKVLSDTTIAGTAGTMANQGAKIITPGTTNKTIAQGYHSGSGYVKGDANLRATNIKKGVSIFGVTGSVIEGRPFASGTATEVEEDDSYCWIVSGLSFTPRFVFWHTTTGITCFGILDGDENRFYTAYRKHTSDTEAYSSSFFTLSQITPYGAKFFTYTSYNDPIAFWVAVG